MDTDGIVILVDTREQRPLIFAGIATERATLCTGDYSIRVDDRDYREIVSIERKGLGDLLGCLGASRVRFERELERLAQFPYRALVIEADMPTCTAGNQRFSQLTPQQVTGSVLSWLFKFNGAPIFAGDRDHAARTVMTLLRLAARYADDHGPSANTPLERSNARVLAPLREALCEVADVLVRGRKNHPGDDGFQQPASFHIERARRHLELLAAGDETEPHLEHAATRLLMALEARATR